MSPRTGEKIPLDGTVAVLTRLVTIPEITTAAIGSVLPFLEGKSGSHLSLIESTPPSRGDSSKRFQVFTVNVYLDPNRTENFEPVDIPRDKAMAIWGKIDALLNLADPATQWPIMGLLSSKRVEDPRILDVPDSDRLIMLTSKYELSWIE